MRIYKSYSHKTLLILCVLLYVSIGAVWSHEGHYHSPYDLDSLYDDHGHESHDHDQLRGPSESVLPSYDIEASSFDTGTVPQVSGHTHVSTLDPDGVMTVYWTPDYVKEEVVWRLEVRTLGWVGFGFSSNGGMKGADIVTAWVKDGRLYLQDRHGTGHTLPPVDAVGNWRALTAYENDTHTVITVARDFNTCDLQDFPLTNETTRLIYAWGPLDPLGEHPPYHGTMRGTRYALVLLPPSHPTLGLEESSYSTWRVNIVKEVPPSKDSLHWCRVEKVPDWDQKHHYIGFSMLHGENSYAHVHHMAVYECYLDSPEDTAQVFEQYVGQPGHECYTPNTTDHFNACERIFFTWAIGSEGEMMPEDVGVPMGEKHGGATYLLIKTHYDHPTMTPNLKVSFALDVYHTDKLRKYEAGNFAVGQVMNFGLTIPPATPNWLVAGHCPQQCTQAAFPPDGVKVFMVFLHAHHLAVALRVRHYRGGRELPPLAMDKHYAVDFQQPRGLRPEVLLLPGDHLTLECDYDSSSRPNATFSGWKARDEVCEGFIQYYPRVKMVLCRSTPSVGTINDALGTDIPRASVDYYKHQFNPNLANGSSYQTFVNAMPWSILNKTAINTKLSHGQHAVKCQYNYGVKMEIAVDVTGYPQNVTPFTPPVDTKCPALTGHDFYDVPKPQPHDHSGHSHDHGDHDHGHHDHNHDHAHDHNHGEHDHDHEHNHDAHDHDHEHNHDAYDHDHSEHEHDHDHNHEAHDHDHDAHDHDHDHNHEAHDHDHDAHDHDHDHDHSHDEHDHDHDHDHSEHNYTTHDHEGALGSHSTHGSLKEEMSKANKPEVLQFHVNIIIVMVVTAIIAFM